MFLPRLYRRNIFMAQFKLVGIVKWKGKKIANGIDGTFETINECIVAILRMKGFEEIKESLSPKNSNEVKSIPKEKHESKARKTLSQKSTKNS